MADAPHYPIGTIQEMAAIPADARQRFLDELPAILDEVKNAQGFYALLSDELGESVTSMGGVVWVDDNMRDYTHTFTNKQSGEEIASIIVRESDAP